MGKNTKDNKKGFWKKIGNRLLAIAAAIGITAGGVKMLNPGQENQEQDKKDKQETSNNFRESLIVDSVDQEIEDFEFDSKEMLEDIKEVYSEVYEYKEGTSIDPDNIEIYKRVLNLGNVQEEVLVKTSNGDIIDQYNPKQENSDSVLATEIKYTETESTTVAKLFDDYLYLVDLQKAIDSGSTSYESILEEKGKALETKIESCNGVLAQKGESDRVNNTNIEEPEL